jgi:hypothetical protein
MNLIILNKIFANYFEIEIDCETDSFLGLVRGRNPLVPVGTRWQSCIIYWAFKRLK